MDAVVAFSLGAELGTSEGWRVVAALDGLELGFAVIATTVVGTSDGAEEGDWLGNLVGASVVGTGRAVVGTGVGNFVGDLVGLEEGLLVGIAVPSVGR